MPSIKDGGNKIFVIRDMIFRNSTFDVGLEIVFEHIKLILLGSRSIENLVFLLIWCF
jgi:hypothetical protein